MTSPSCDCCPDCEVPPLPIVSYWTPEYGDWSFNVGGPEIDEDGICYTTKFIDVLEGYSKATVDVLVTEEGASIAILLAYVDADNYLAAQVQFGPDGCGGVRLYQRSGGVGTVLRDWEPVAGLDYNQTHHIEACYSPAYDQPELGNRFSCVVPAPNGLTRTISVFGVTTGASLSAAGLRAEELSASDFTFTNWHWYYVYDPYDHPECPQCFGTLPCLITEAPAVLPSCEWSEESGVGDFDTATLRTSISFARLITEVSNPALSTNGHIEADVSFDTAGDSALFILGWKDSDNYCYAKVTCGDECGAIAVGQVVAGSVTETSQYMLAATTGTRLTVCFDLIAGSATLIVTPDDTYYTRPSGYVRQVRASLTVHAEGYKAGLAVGSISGEVTFHQWGWFLTPVETPLCEPCHSCMQHNDEFQRHFTPAVLGCEWVEDTHALTDADTPSGKVLVLAPGETVTSAIDLFGIGVIAEVHYDFPGDPTGIKLQVGDMWAEVSGGVLADSQGQTDTLAPGDKTLRLCLHDGISRATAGSVAGFVSSSGTPSSKVVSVTNTGGEDLHVGFFSAAARSIDDQTCNGCASECSDCVDNAWPSSLLVTIGGLADVFGDTTCCSILNGAWYLDGHSTSTTISGKTACWADFTEEDPDCVLSVSGEYFHIAAYLIHESGTQSSLLVEITLDQLPSHAFTYRMGWRKFFDSQDNIVDCLTLNELLTDANRILPGSAFGVSRGYADFCTTSGITILAQAV